MRRGLISHGHHHIQRACCHSASSLMWCSCPLGHHHTRSMFASYSSALTHVVRCIPVSSLMSYVAFQCPHTCRAPFPSLTTPHVFIDQVVTSATAIITIPPRQKGTNFTTTTKTMRQQPQQQQRQPKAGRCTTGAAAPAASWTRRASWHCPP